MKHIDDYTDDRQKGSCIHCGASLGNSKTTKDHIPSKTLLDRPLPDNVHTVDICFLCNNGFSGHEEYFAAFLSATMAGSTVPEVQPFGAGRKALAGNAKMRRLIDESATQHVDEDGETRLTWHPDLERIRPVVIKNARGHVFFELGLPFYHEPAHVITQPLVTAPEEWLSDFLTVDHGNGWPEVGSRLLQRLVSGDDMAAGWTIVQLGVYVFAVFEDDDGVVARSIIREYLLTEVRWNHRP